METNLNQQLSEICLRMHENKSEEVLRNLVRILEQMLREKTMVLVPIKEGTSRVAPITIGNDIFPVFFTEMKYVRTKPGILIYEMDINEIITIAARSHLEGIAINPFTPECQCAIRKDQFKRFCEMPTDNSYLEEW